MCNSMLLDVNILGDQKRFLSLCSLLLLLLFFTTDSKNDFQTEISNESSPSDMEGFEEENLFFCLLKQVLFSQVEL